MDDTSTDAASEERPLHEILAEDDARRKASTPDDLPGWQVKLREKMPSGAFDARPTLLGWKQGTGVYSPVRFVLFWLVAVPWYFGWEKIPAIRATVNELIDRRIVTVKQLADDIQLTLVCLNQRGGAGKTPVSTGIAAFLAWAAEQLIMLVDANQTKGNTASRIGVKASMTIRQALEATQNMTQMTYEWVVRNFARHPELGYGSLRVMDSDDAQGRHDQGVNTEELVALFTKAKPAVHSMIFDGGNSTDAPIVEASAQFADVHVYVAFPSRENNLTDCRDTINHYLRVYPDKVQRGVLVMVGVKQRGWFGRKSVTSAEGYARLLGFPAEQVIVIPEDPFYGVGSVGDITGVVHEEGLSEGIREIDSTNALDALIKTIEVEKLRPRTQLAYLDLLILAFHMQRRSNLAKAQAEADLPQQDGEVIENESTPSGAQLIVNDTAKQDQVPTPPPSTVNQDSSGTTQEEVNLHELASSVRSTRT